MTADIKIKEISCKSALVKSQLYGLDYAINPYRGCEHGCIYCYAPFVLREERKWGEFVDIRRNMPYVLSKELKTKKKGIVGISTVTDAYQPIEKKYELTRKCLEQLLKHNFPINIQTKSSLVARDLDIIKKFSHKEIGFTITTIDDEIRKKLEPNSSTIEERLATLEKIAENQISTWVFIGPIMPYLTDKNDSLEQLIKNLTKCKVKLIFIDKLNLKFGLWKKIESYLSNNYDDLIINYKEILFTKNNYFKDVTTKIIHLCKKYGISFEVCF